MDHGRPAPDWRELCADALPLRDWQADALDAWAAHGRHGVIQAVTGTGKSRVGIEAIREALSHDYSVVVVVPTVDLVEQWFRALARQGVRNIGRNRAPFSKHDVVVGTVQSLYPDPPTRQDGKVLVVADECHRYGAEEWRRALHPSYRRRLGLTATFERNDDGINELLTYFGGSPVYDIGFAQAIDQGVVARYDVKLRGVKLSAGERAEYDDADRTVRDTRLKLIAADFPSEPFGAFLHAVQEAAEDDDDPTVSDTARLYLKAFSRRIDVMSGAQAKLAAVDDLAPVVQASHGALLFTRRVDVAEEMAAALRDRDVHAEAVHSGLTRRERQDRLSYLRVGRLKALVAPTVLDEGIDVPTIDLAVVLGGSKSRRQMIQRMGRVLRLKPDGGKATFIVVYAQNTIEDLTANDGVEGCLDLIVEAADTVQHLDPSSATISGILSKGASADLSDARGVEEGAGDGLDQALDQFRSLDVKALTMSRRAVDSYIREHGGTEADAATMLRRILSDMQQSPDTVVRHIKERDLFEARNRGFSLLVRHERFNDYRSQRPNGVTWVDAQAAPPAAAVRRDRPVVATPPNAVLRPDAPNRKVPLRTQLAKSEPQVVANPRSPVPPDPAVVEEPRGDDLISRLERLAELRTADLLTDAEFSAAKAKLLF